MIWAWCRILAASSIRPSWRRGSRILTVVKEGSCVRGEASSMRKSTPSYSLITDYIAADGFSVSQM